MALEDHQPQIIPPVPVPPESGVVLPPDADALPTVVVDPSPPPPFGRTWAFDHALGRFVRTGSTEPRLVFGAVTLIVWIDKALHTTRGALPVHPPGYGLPDPFAYFGRPVAELSVHDIERDWKETLTFHPRIADVVNVALGSDPFSDVAVVSYDVLTDPPLDDAQLLQLRTTLASL